jgi:hypothetical protein
MQPQAATNFRKRLRMLVAVVIVLIGGLIIYEIVRSFQLHIVSTDPALSDVATVSPFLKVNFNNPLSSSNLSVSSQSGIIQSYSVANKTLTINFVEPLALQQTYTITIASVADTAGKRLTNTKLSFIAKYVSSNKLSTAQTQAQLQTQSQYSQTPEANPLAQELPYLGAGEEFRIDDSVQTNNQIVITITAPNPQAQQDALTWITSQGYNPAKLDIKYVTAQP